MSSDGRTREQVAEDVLALLKAEAARRDPYRVELAFNDLMMRFSSVGKMHRKGQEAGLWLR